MKSIVKTLLVSSMIAGSLAAPAGAQTTKVSWVRGAPWSPGEALIPFGIALGFFKEEGIEIDPVAVGGAGVMVPQLAQGAVDVGQAPVQFLMVAAAKGTPFPVRNVLKAYPNPGFEFVVPANSPIKSLADLKGKKIGIGELSWGNLPMTRVYLKDAGLAEKDVEAIPVGMGPAAWKQLTDGNIQALNLFTGQHDLMEASGIAIRRLDLPEKYRMQMDAGVVTSEKNVKERPELLKKLLRAYVRSSAACRAAPENCAKSFWAFDPSSKPEAGKEEAWIKLNGHLNKLNEDHKWKNQVAGAFGTYTDEDWLKLSDLMKATGVLGDKPIDPKAMYTNEFVKFANDFNMDATIAAARAYK